MDQVVEIVHGRQEHFYPIQYGAAITRSISPQILTLDTP